MTHQTINVNDVIDHAKFKPFHFNVVAWCLLIILFDGYDLAINGVVLPLMMDEWGLSVNGNLKLTPFTLKQQSKIDPFDDLLRLNLWLNSYSLFIF